MKTSMFNIKCIMFGIAMGIFSLAQTGYAAEPTLQIDSIVGSSGTIRINYTAYDVDGDSVITSGWQYSPDNSKWYDIDQSQIGNNVYKSPSTSYITWDTIGNFRGVYGSSVWFKMKGTDSSGIGKINSFNTSSNNIPIGLNNHSSVVYNGYLYITGGLNGSSYLNKVYYAKINSDGSIGSFSTSSNNIPVTLAYHSSVVYNGYLYITGGYSNGSPISKVYYAKINSNGSIGNFLTSSNNIPNEIYTHSSVVYNGYLYITGGFSSNFYATNKIYYAKINNDGSIGTFTTSSNNIPINLRAHSSVVYNGYLYLTGGAGGVNKVYYAKINSDGSISSFSTSSNNIPVNLYYHSSVVYNGFLYITGGWTGSSYLNKVYYTRINPDGNIGSFSTSSNNIPDTVCYHSSVFYNGYLYITGGSNGSPKNTVYYSSFSDISSDYATPLSFQVYSNDPPIAAINTPSGVQLPDVPLSYNLSNIDCHPLSIFCQYSTNNGVTWSPATVIGSTSNVTSAVNYSGTITWNSQADIAYSSATVRFRITPSDPYTAGTAGVTSSFFVDYRHNPHLVINSLSDNTDEPSALVKISYTASDADGSNIQTSSWQYSRDNLVWYDISASAITNNDFKGCGSSYIWWDTQSGTNNLNLIEDNSVWFRMKLFDGVFNSSMKIIGPFAIDNYVKPVISLSNISGEVTANTLTINYTITAAPDENISFLCQYSNGGINWSNATVTGSTSNITSSGFSGSLIWNSLTDIGDGTDAGSVYFRIKPIGRVLGNATTTNAIHIDYNDKPSVVLSDIYTIQRDTVAISYVLSDTENDALSIFCQYSKNGGTTWNKATVTGSTSNITSANYIGSLIWYSNLDEQDINCTTVKFKITPYDNDSGTADDNINFQLINKEEAPSISLTSVEGDSCIKINYTATDPDAGEQITTTGWQYSLDNSTWHDIDVSAIGNNSYKNSGSSYILWYSTKTLPVITDSSVWFKMKAVDSSGNAGSSSGYVTSPYFAINNYSEAPTLLYSGETNYTSSFLYPLVGKSTTTFTYRVKYADAHNKEPLTGYPKLHILKNGNEILNSPFIMSETDTSDTTYNDGKIYNYSLLLSSAGIGYSYYLEAYNVNGTSGTVTTANTGPIVLAILPSSPTITCQTHPDQTQEYACDAPVFTISGPTSTVVIAGYYYIFNQTSQAVPCQSSGTFTANSTITFSSVPDGTWYLHAVAKDGDGNIGVQAGHFKINIKTTINPNTTNTFLLTDGTKIELPAGSVNGTTKINVNQPSCIPDCAYSSNLKATSCAREIKLTDSSQTLQKTITITIPYTDSDITGMNEANLKVAYYDESKAQWVLIPGCTVYPNDKKIVFSVNHLTLFRIVEYKTPSTPVADLSNYPNPFTARSGGKTKIRYDLSGNTDTEVFIYDLIGQAVMHMSFAAGNYGAKAGPNEVEWDGKNERGNYVTAGGYICVVKSNGTTMKTKIGVK
ncbi:MAG: hypothetical protein LHV68_07860 [Elusimicrobia bacterium]|nr:hypothetical protein [Candidatus Liberimonas magnetica]